MKKLSIKDRAMAAGLNSQSKAPTSAHSTSEPEDALPHSQSSRSNARIATGPGALAAFMSRESEVFEENKLIKEELKTWDGALPTKRLNPNDVFHSRWANRHGDSFLDPEFEEFKAEIQSAGGNIQPIKVRPLPGTEPLRYEIVFGHRRHRACLDLGLSVVALVESITDKSLFEEMDRENRQRSDLRPYEQGVMYRRALDEGLFPSISKLAEAIGVDRAIVSKSLALSKLPDSILNAFPSRLDIQYRWLTKLTDALDANHQDVMDRALAIAEDRKNGAEVPSHVVFDRLINTNVNDQNLNIYGNGFFEVNGKTVAKTKISADRYSVQFEKGAVTKKQIAALEQAIAKLLNATLSTSDH